jgi:hypothetical protein
MCSPINRIGILAGHEQAAFDTYREALLHAPEYHQQELHEIQSDHEEAARLLQSIAPSDETPGSEFGGWELMSKAMPGVDKLFGKQAALQTLHDCEEMAMSDYENCLRDNGIPYKSRSIIMNRLLPQARNHLKRLEELMHHVPETKQPARRRVIAVARD